MGDIEEINEAINEIYKEENREVVAPYTLLLLTRAYNLKEITFEEWLHLTKEWAESMIAKYGKVENKPV